MMKRKRSKRESKYCYESPLNVFKKSLEELTSIVGDIVYQKNGRLSRGMLQRLNEQNATDSSSRDSSLQNSVIVINDSDSETAEEGNDEETNVKDKDTSVSVVECVSTPTSSLRQYGNSRISGEQNTNRPSIIPLDTTDNESSALDLSAMQESLNEENIAPTQTEDDVVELWSCLKQKVRKVRVKKNGKSNHGKNPLFKINKKNGKSNYCGKSPLFKIDKRPNLKYLECLKTDTIYSQSEKSCKKKQDLSHDKPTPESFISLTVKPVKPKTLKCSDSNQRKRRYDDILDSSQINIFKSNVHHSKKRIYLGEESRWHDDNLDSSSTKSNVDHSKKRIDSEEKNSQTKSTRRLREIVVDGCNVAMAHTNGKGFSEKGIQIVIDYFKLRGHVVKVFLPQHVRKKEHTLIEKLYKEGTVVFTPSRLIDGRQITSYDDRFILKYATTCGGVVISTDQYRDLYREKPEWRNTILHRLLIPTFVGDYIMFPEDPLGRFGPNLETFLRH